jgi:lipopolysaccharide export system protein LptA
VKYKNKIRSSVKFVCCFLLLITAVYSKAQDKITLNHADSLIGKVINNEQVREAIGNVSLKHNNLLISCNRVIQYFDQNKAELYGNVRVVKDTLTIEAPAGTYFGNDRKVTCPSGATLNDSKVTLKANYGIYYFDNDIANFRGNVRIYDSKSYTIYSDELVYHRQVNKSISTGNVKIETDSTVIYSDTLIYEKLAGTAKANGSVKIESDSTLITSSKATFYEFEKKSIAEDNVVIYFPYKNLTIRGNYGENYERTNYSFVKGYSELIKIDQKDTVSDTLFIYSNKMEAFRNTPEHYIATDSVKVIRNDFLSSSSIGYYFKTDEKSGVISLAKNPVVWKEDMQITGDSIFAFHREDIEIIRVLRNSFAIKFHTDYTNRFDQMSGVNMHLSFRNNEINDIRVDTNASSIYYVFEKSEPNGVNSSEGEYIHINFYEGKVVKVNVAGSPKGVYTPENLLQPDNLFLPGFKIRLEKPKRRE